MGISFIFIISNNSELRTSIYNLIFDGDLRPIIAGFIFFTGLALAIFHFFSSREKAAGENILF